MSAGPKDWRDLIFGPLFCSVNVGRKQGDCGFAVHKTCDYCRLVLRYLTQPYLYVCKQRAGKTIKQKKEVEER